jgi:cytochrome c-type biogenesis protein CcmH
MPLAVQRLKVSDLPATVTLDDGMAMMPAMRLSAFPEVLVGARISKSGQATPSSGDLEGQTGPVSVAGAPEVAVTIDKQRP